MLPLDIPPQLTTCGPIEQRPSPTGRRDPPGVLVVDDERGVREVVAAWLTRHGFPVWAAAGGPEAVMIFRERRAVIRVALLDVQMPDRDGPEVLADLRAIDPNVRVCFMTGDSGRYSAEHLADLGALIVFRKPLRLDDVTERLAALAAA